MSNYYAQLNDDMIVKSVTQVSAPITDPKMIPIESVDESLLMMRWNGSDFEEVPVEPSVEINLFDLRERFTEAEMVGVYMAAKSNILIQIWMDHLLALQVSEKNPRLDDYRIVRGVNAMEADGVIGPGRAAQILTP